MKKNTAPRWALILLALAAMSFGMARRGEYDYEAREEARIARIKHKDADHSQSAAQNFASGIRDVASGPAQLLSETAQGTASEKSVDGALEGANAGSERLLDSTLKGTVKVATLGFGNLKNYEVEEPKAGSGDTTKIKIKIPGT